MDRKTEYTHADHNHLDDDFSPFKIVYTDHCADFEEQHIIRSNDFKGPPEPNCLCPTWAQLLVSYMGTTACVLHGHNCLCPTWAQLLVSYMGTTACVLHGHNCLCPTWAQLLVSYMGTTACVLHGHNCLCPTWAHSDLF